MPTHFPIPGYDAMFPGGYVPYATPGIRTVSPVATPTPRRITYDKALEDWGKWLGAGDGSDLAARRITYDKALEDWGKWLDAEPVLSGASGAVTPAAGGGAATAAVPTVAVGMTKPVEILAALIDGTLSWNDAYTALFDARGPNTDTGLTSEQIKGLLQRELASAYRDTAENANRSAMVAKWQDMGVPQNVLDQVIEAGVSRTVQDRTVQDRTVQNRTETEIASDLAARRITYDQALEEMAQIMWSDGTSRDLRVARTNAPAHLDTMLVGQVTRMIQDENLDGAQKLIEQLGSAGIFKDDRVTALTNQITAARAVPAGQIEEIKGLAETGLSEIAPDFGPSLDIQGAVDTATAERAEAERAAAAATGALGLTDEDRRAADYETYQQRRRLFESKIPEGQPGIRRFLQRRFDPLNAQFLLRQALQQGGPLSEEPESPLNFLDFMNTSNRGAGLGTDVRDLIAAMRGGTGSEAQNLFYQGVEEVGPTRELAKAIGLQYRLGSVPNILQSLVASRMPFREVEDQLREAITGRQKGFERFATVGPAANISELLQDIQNRQGTGDIAGYQRLMEKLGPTITDQEGQQGAFNIALQSRLQGAPLAFRSSIEQLARQNFDRWLVKNPNTAFLPHYLRDQSFSPIVSEFVT